MFSTQTDTMDILERLDFESHKGYFTILNTDASAGAEGNSPLMQINIHMGDKM